MTDLIVIRRLNLNLRCPPLVATVTRQRPLRDAEAVRCRVLDEDVELAHHITVHVVVEDETRWLASVTRHHGRDEARTFTALFARGINVHIVTWIRRERINEKKKYSVLSR